MTITGWHYNKDGNIIGFAFGDKLFAGCGSTISLHAFAQTVYVCTKCGLEASSPTELCHPVPTS